MNYIYFAIFTLVTTFFLNHSKLYAHKIDQNEINTIIKSFIQNNPDLIEKSLDKLKIKRTTTKLKNSLTALSNIHNPKLTRKDSDIIIYEFFDYNCGYCKVVMQSLFNVFEKDKKVDVVFVEFPILSESSLAASLSALAFNKQNKYFEIHSRLMNFKGKIDQKLIFSIANELKIDKKQLKKDISETYLMDVIKKNRQIAQQLNIQGTPAFIIGNKIYPGAMNEDEILKAIKIERNKLR